MQSAVVATVKHGDRLQILQHRRIFFRVRTASGAEGWVDERQLLSSADMQSLKRLSGLADKLPSQGAAVGRYGDMRVYSQPSLESPSFITVKDKEKVDVLAHVEAPRVHLTRAPLLRPAPKKVFAKKKKEPAIPPVPLPAPPKPPGDWQELSKTESDEPPDEPANQPPPKMDDWSLVRTADGEAGWTLTRRLDMAIPFEVAQYSEGRRIVSYFPLATVHDGDATKKVWLWTTIGSGEHPYDFDNFRVFIWSLRHHRYETSYIERNVMGFAPVTLETVTYAGAQYPGFSVCTQSKDGTRSRREFALLDNIVRFAGERQCEAKSPAQQLTDELAAKPSAPGASGPGEAKPSFTDRVKRKVRAWFKR